MPHVEVPQAEFKVVMLGDTFAGKTSLVLRFAEGHFRDSARSATVSAHFITKRLTVQGLTCKVQIWDTAGQNQFKKLAPMYYKQSAAAIICYDITSQRSFETLKYWVEEVRKTHEAEDMVLALCATKCDLAESPPDTLAAETLAREIGAIFMTTSSKENFQVSELFEKVAAQVLDIQNDEGSTIPVRLSTTYIEKDENADNSGISAHGRIGTPGAKPMLPSRFPLVDEKKLEDEDDVIDPKESRDSSKAERMSRCDASNMLMCVDTGGESGSGCLIS